uniref:MobH family relaxase n=2 Tax=Neisseria sp. TaxID=192066 RepID=UPI0035A0574F
MNTPDWLLYGGIGAAALWLLPRLMPRKHGENHPPAITDTSAPQLRPPAIANGRFRILDAESLIYELGLAPSVANIKSQLGLTNENWDRDGLPLLHNFITLVQRLPASESHHHAGDGGLAKHTLDVAAMALLASNAKSWPPDAKTEDIARLSTVWRYGILAAALLHDIGKVITSFEIPLYKTSDDDNFILWQPDTGRMSDSGRTFYRVVFPDHKTPYSVHKTLGWTFFQNIVPQHARGWMAASDPNLVNALRNYLGGSDEKSALAEIIRTADMQSVARDLKFGSRQRLATAKRRPLNEIVMDTLIEMLAERGAYFSIATTAGGDLFYHGGMVYMMAKNVPDRVRDFLAANEPQLAKSIPSDNQRIFDTLLEYGLVEANTFDPGKAVSNIAVTFAKSDGELKTYPFTVLKFRPETLFPNGPLPAEFAGVLKELDAPIKRQAVSDGHTDRKDDAVSADDVPSETRNTVHEAQTAGHIPEDCVIPPPPKARRLPDTEPKSIEPKSIEPKSIEPKSIEPKSIEPKSIEPKSIEPKSIGQH